MLVLKLIEMFVMEYTGMIVVIMKVVMVEKLKYKLKVEFVMNIAEVSKNMSKMKSMREVVTRWVDM